MIEVILSGNRWRWTMICPAGRTLVWSNETYDSNNATNDAAKAWRTSFWAHAAQIDHRMGAAA